MYRCTDTFIHDEHVAALGDNASCGRCHPKAEAVKTRARATACVECHRADIVTDLAERGRGLTISGALGDIDCAGCHGVSTGSAPGGESDRRAVDGIAPGYRFSMHRLCVGCHCDHEVRAAVDEPQMTRCGFCHRGVERELELEPSSEIGSKTMVIAGGAADLEAASK